MLNTKFKVDFSEKRRNYETVKFWAEFRFELGLTEKLIYSD